MDKPFIEIKKILQLAAKDETKKTLLYVYYSGFSYLDNLTKIVLNEEDPNMRFYNLE